MQKKLIVHADDFGLTEKVNDGIIKAHLDGILTSTSIMANGSAFDHAVRLARSTPSLDIGVHLTLINENPILPPERLPTLVDSIGRMHNHAFGFTRRYLLGRINLEEAKAELESQIKMILQAGIIPSHLDSHQHLHMLPGVLKTVIELSRKYKIPVIRYPREAVSLGKMRQVSPPRIAQALLLNFFCKVADGRIERRTDSFAGFLYGGNLNKENFLKILKNLSPDSICEIMCHPGLDDPDSPYSYWGYKWEDELQALLDPEINDMIIQNGIRLISYTEFSKNGVTLKDSERSDF
jgi:hopanoid biosynthesis associated protein HpnK